MSGDVCRRVAAFLRRYDLSGSRLVVAVSGGPDSVCLLHVLATLKEELRLDLRVAHLNHMLRGEESHADAEYVSALAFKMGFTVDIGKDDVHSLRRRRKMTLEEAARDARYRFLAQVADKYNTDLIVTGHTQNDQVETLLLHIIRGCGIQGLVGLKPITSRIIENQQAKIIRPILDITKGETHDYCHIHNLSPRLDSSNLDQSPMRNRIRMQLLPLLETYNDGIAEALLRLSGVAGDEVAYLDDQVLHLAQQAITRKGDVVSLDRWVLADVHPVLLRYLLRSCLEQFPNGLHDIESVHIEKMLSLMKKPAGRQMSLPHDLLFLTGYDCYWLGRERDLPCQFPPLENNYSLLIPGVTSLYGWYVEAAIVDAVGRYDDPMVAYMDMDAAGVSLCVRSWHEGDCFHPLGLHGTKKLGEFMIDAHIPRNWRKRIPVVSSPAGVIWLVGYRLDNRVKVTEKTQRILRLEFHSV